MTNVKDNKALPIFAPRQMQQNMGRNSHILPTTGAPAEKAVAYLSSINIGCRILWTILVPALLCCCTMSIEKEAPRKAEAPPGKASLDVFFFNADSLGRLDSYQRMIWDGALDIGAVSTRGPRRICVMANSSDDRYTWAQINSYEGLQQINTSLCEENPQMPVMSSECISSTGEDSSQEMRLSPLLARVRLSSISCDFHSRPYEGSLLEDVKVYLTNVSGRCSPFSQHYDSPSEILNKGRLRAEDLAGMRAPGMLYKEIEGPVGENVRYTDLDLYCYPNTAPSEGIGTPFTRLVIEGRIDGRTWYYPLDINRDGGCGLERGHCYSLDVTICRKGSRDPDTPVRSATAQVSLEILPWEQKPEKTISY